MCYNSRVKDRARWDLLIIGREQLGNEGLEDEVRGEPELPDLV